MDTNDGLNKTKAQNSGDTGKGKMKRIFKFRNLTSRQKDLLEKASLGAGGVGLGVLVMALMGAGNRHADDTLLNSGDAELEVTVYPKAPFCESVSDDMSFNDAFALARKEVGPGGFFEWKGETYNTYYKEEWDSMTPEDKMEFAASIEESEQGQSITEEDEIIRLLNDEPEFEDLDHEDIVIEDEGDGFEIDDDVTIIEDDDNGFAELGDDEIDDADDLDDLDTISDI